MEFVLLPSNAGNTPIVPKTPYLGRRCYDRGPFLSYPTRVGKAEASAASFDLQDYHRAERVSPTPLRDQESFVQTWLYFGFISEFLCINSKDDTNQAAPPEGSQEIIDQIYNTIVLQDGDKNHVVLDEDSLETLLSLAKSRLPGSNEAQIQHYEHLLNCISHAHSILGALPQNFNHPVKFSISALHELVAQTIRSLLSPLGVNRVFGRAWAFGYLNQEAKVCMMQHGWYPSDIERVEVKFSSVQAMHVARLMDKSLPKRDRELFKDLNFLFELVSGAVAPEMDSRCTDVACNIHQINKGSYKVLHEHPDCSCDALIVPALDLEEILCKKDRFPLLRLTGDLYNLNAELAEGDDDTPFIAISHVWADGLGNPLANSLQRCKLDRVRDLVSGVDHQDKSDEGPPLFWLDTLCCPAEDGKGKQMAIERIRLVYQRAKYVLVLDAGLMAYEAKNQGIHEKVMRIFTSGWVRRLWTLQEGALAPSLYFQFADEAVSLRGLRMAFGQYANSVRHQVFALDSMQEFWRIDAFFKSSEHNYSGEHPSLNVLDQALQFRSVSVASDEPLCIGALMSLDLKAILEVVPKEQRMQKVWGLLAEKRGGIPAQILFFEEQRINSIGWRWAPRSLLSVEKSIRKGNLRNVMWEGQLGVPTGLGLKVRLPGFKISITKYEDGKPRHPWPGLTRLPESYMHFRDGETGEWYIILDTKYAYLSSTWITKEARVEYNKLEKFPLHDLADSNKSLIVMRTMTNLREAIFALPIPDADCQDAKLEDGLAVRTERHIIVNQLMPENGYIYTTIGKLAMKLRADGVTDKHLEIHKHLKAEFGDSREGLKAKLQENEEFQASIKVLREKMKDMTAEVIKEDARFVEAVKANFGESLLEDIWLLIQDWFNHGYVGRRLSEEQVWYVD